MSKVTCTVVCSPHRSVALIAHDGIVTAVTGGTVDTYVGMDVELAAHTLATILRYRTGNERLSTSADGYPSIITVECVPCTFGHKVNVSL